MKKNRMISVCMLLLVVSLACMAKEYVITDHGAVRDGITLNTEAIQSAIDQAHSDGGGTVIVPEGVFLSGTLVLKSNVALHLEKNAVILGSTNRKHYATGLAGPGLIIAGNQENITVSGEGRIDGQGQELALAIDSLHHTGEWPDPNYNYRRKRPSWRPKLFQINSCNNIRVTGITAMNSASWVLNFEDCQNLDIDQVHIESDVYWNNDGIDIGDCKHVRITNCYINAADDGICLKSSDPDSFCDQIYIANNTVRSSASGIKFGTASAGGFKNVKIENITIFNTFRSALAFEAVDGGTLENVTATNVTATNTGNAIFIKLGHRNIDGQIGRLRNIHISNLNVDVPFSAPDINYRIRGPELSFFHNPFPASISGLPGHYVENVTIENVEISYPGRADKGYAYVPLWNLDSIPEQESEYPEFSMFGELPSWGFYFRHVDGLKIRNVRLSIREDDYRHAVVFDDVKNITIEGGSITVRAQNPQVVVKDVDGLDINNLLIDGKELEIVPSYGDNINIEGVRLIKQAEINNE